MSRADRIRLQHMLDAAREAMSSLEGRTRADLERNRIWALGLIKCVEIFDLDLDQIWSAVTEDLPQLATELEKTLTDQRET